MSFWLFFTFILSTDIPPASLGLPKTGLISKGNWTLEIQKGFLPTQYDLGQKNLIIFKAQDINVTQPALGCSGRI